jgi:hypothetical protein
MCWQVVEFVQQQTHQERRGPAVETLKDDELFFVDKGPADSNAEALLAQAQQPAKKKREKRPTRAQLILSAPQKIKPVVPPKGAPKKDQGPINPQNARLEQLKKQQEKAAQLERQKQWIAKQSGPAALDVWGDSVPSAGEDAEAGPGPGSTQLALVGTTGAPNGHLATFLEDLPEATLREGRSAKRSNGRRQISPGPIKPVEIDMAGCSYNPVGIETVLHSGPWLLLAIIEGAAHDAAMTLNIRYQCHLPFMQTAHVPTATFIQHSHGLRLQLMSALLLSRLIILIVQPLMQS